MLDAVQAYADVGLGQAGDVGHVGVGELVEVEQDERAVERRELVDLRVEPGDPLALLRRGGELGCLQREAVELVLVALAVSMTASSVC